VVLNKSLKKGIIPAITNAEIHVPARIADQIPQPVYECEYRCLELRSRRKNMKRATTEAYNTPSMTIVGRANEYATFLKRSSRAP
jgi:hypothetical protein